jgi:hypothetical protein
MRPGQHNKRGRNRHRGGSGGSSGGGGGNPLSRVYESNGPDVKVRGNAQTIADKYLQLGRDAQSSGDIVMAENYYQHAEHYLRIVAAAQAYQQQVQAQYRGPREDYGEDEEGDLPESAAAGFEPRAVAPGEQPEVGGEQPYETAAQMQPPRDYRDRDRDGGQSFGYRDRGRQRWQDRRDQQQGQPRETRQEFPQPRPEDSPQPDGGNAQPPVGNGAGEGGQWEAPSFLRRPAPAESASEPGGSAPQRRPRMRLSRRESGEGSGEPPTPPPSED